MRKSKKSQSAAGAPARANARPTEPVRVSVIHYNNAQEEVFAGTDEIQRLLQQPGVTWVNVAGLHEVEVVDRLASMFGIHPLIREDILDTTHRPKVQDLEEYLFLVLRTLRFDQQAVKIHSRQISLIIGQNYLISFQENGDDLSAAIGPRLAVEQGRLRKSGPDHLAYCILDTVVDEYFDVLEKLGERIEFLEEELVSKASRTQVKDIHTLKTQMISVRKAVWPLREVVNRLLDGESPLIKENTIPYLRDVYDHTIHCIDTIETFRDIVSGMLDIYLSSVSYRVNEIMKVLTIIATIFIPLTFLSGWYGMNFKYMPELQWQYGYPMVIAIAISIVTGLLIYFRRKHWW